MNSHEQRAQPASAQRSASVSIVCIRPLREVAAPARNCRTHPALHRIRAIVPGPRPATSHICGDGCSSRAPFGSSLAGARHLPAWAGTCRHCGRAALVTRTPGFIPAGARRVLLDACFLHGAPKAAQGRHLFASFACHILRDNLVKPSQTRTWPHTALLSFSCPHTMQPQASRLHAQGFHITRCSCSFLLLRGRAPRSRSPLPCSTEDLQSNTP